MVILTIRNKTKYPKFHKDFPANYGSHYQDSTISRPIKWPLGKSTTPIFSNFFRKKKKKRSQDPSRTAESVSHFQNLSMQNWVLTLVPCQTPFGSRTNLKKSIFFPKKGQKIQNSTNVSLPILGPILH